MDDVAAVVTLGYASRRSVISVTRNSLQLWGLAGLHRLQPGPSVIYHNVYTVYIYWCHTLAYTSYIVAMWIQAGYMYTENVT